MFVQRRARLCIRQADAADRLWAVRKRPMCCLASRSFSDLFGTGLPARSYRDRHGLPQVVDRDRQNGVGEW